VLALTGVAIGLLQLGVTGAALNGGVLTLARNVIGITGIGLLASLVTGGLLAWILPLGYVGFAEYALAEAWRNPWTWPVRRRRTAAPGSAPCSSSRSAWAPSRSEAPAPASPMTARQPANKTADRWVHPGPGVPSDPLSCPRPGEHRLGAFSGTAD
jgi:hypothetical protein